MAHGTSREEVTANPRGEHSARAQLATAFELSPQLRCPLARERKHGYPEPEAINVAQSSQHLEIGGPIRPLRRAEYEQLVSLGAFENERIELLEGALVEMSPVGASHCAAVQELTLVLVPAVAGRATVRIQMPFAALDASEPEPDVAIVPLGTYREAHPSRAHLIIEVAESSLRRDRGVKQRIYAQARVPEYWVVNLEERSIDVFTSPTSDGYASVARVEHGASVTPGSYPDVSVAVARIVG